MVCLRPPVWFELASGNISFVRWLIFYIFYNYQFNYHYQGQNNRLVGSKYFRGFLLATENLLHLLDVKVDSILQISDLGNSPGYLIFNFFYFNNYCIQFN